MSISNQEARVTPKDAAENVLGTIRWEENETKGFCTCPGESQHNGSSADRDCVVYLNDVATIFCLHQSCVEEVRDANRALRGSIATGQPVDSTRRSSPEEKRRKQKEAQRLNQLELRGRTSLPQILKDHRWTYADIQRGTKEAPANDVATHWRHIVELFRADDVLWIGNKHDSGGSEHQRNFKTAEEWLRTTAVVGQLTCPAAFKSNSTSRSNDNVLHRRFLVVESDVLSKDDVGAVFRWLRDAVGFNLRAVVDTAGKSLHGWFDYPKKVVLEQLEIILPQLGCDAGLFRASQPCRIPGALRDDKYQKLIYLDKAPGARTAKMPSQVLPLPELYYDGFGQCYWRKTTHGTWQKINEKSFDTDLLARGFSNDEEPAEPLSELARTRRDIQLGQDLVYAGRLAGYHSGLHTILNQRILVTESPKIIAPKAGAWPTLQRFFEGLLRHQTPYFYGWMKLAYQALRTGEFTSGQAFAIAGPVNCGKSLLENLVTEIMGGRVAKPYHFMTGKSNFNSELFGAEHLMIEDESASTKFEARRNLGAAIKNLTVNVTQTCYGKNKTALTLTPLWRLTLSMNEEPEDLMVLPPYEEGVYEKLMLVKGYENPAVAGINTGEGRKRLWETLTGELPAFLAHLEALDIPVELRADRMGVRTYHHPQLLAKMRELQPEQRLLSLIDDCIFRFEGDDWDGAAIALERRLTHEDYALHYEARQLLRGQNSCGTYLGRLTKYPESRVSQRLVHGQTQWTIQAPERG